MRDSSSPFSLEELLEHCCNPASPRHETAWKEFCKRYKQFIAYRVIKRCSFWKKIARLEGQFEESVNDVIGAVLQELCKNNYHSLRSFQARDNESKFRSWLATICLRQCDRYIRPRLWESITDDRVEYIDSLDFGFRWELYETVVQELRDLPQRKAKNFERDINIFQLHVFADFPGSVICRTHPCLRILKDHAPDVVVHRLRKHLRKRKEFLS